MTTVLKRGTTLADYPVAEITRDRMVAVMELMGDLSLASSRTRCWPMGRNGSSTTAISPAPRACSITWQNW